METMTIIINSPPYGAERVWNALRLATASISAPIGMNVNIFLLGDAVSAAKKKQNTPEGYYNLEKMLGDLIAKGAKILACGTCLNSRALSQEELVDGVEIGTMIKLATWIKDSSKVVSF